MIENNEETGSTGLGTARMNEMRERAGEIFEDAKTTATDALDRGDTYVRDNPMTSILVALAGGFLLGLAVSPRRQTFNERYIEEPLNKSQGMIMAATLAVATLGRQLFRSARSSGRDALKSSQSMMKPMRKVARQVSRKMHL